MHPRSKVALAAAGALALVLAGAATQANAADPKETVTVLSVDGNTSDVTLALKNGQYPKDHKAVTLASTTKWLSDTGWRTVTSGGPVRYYQNGELLKAGTERVKLLQCVTTFRAHYPGNQRFKESPSQTVTVTLVGGHCPTPTPTPTPTDEPTTEPTDEPTDEPTTPTVTVTTTAPGATDVILVPVGVPVAQPNVVKVPAGASGDFTG